jgi:hypothetical protein
VRPAIEDRRLGRLADRADTALERLAEDPNDERGAGGIEKELGSVAEAAGKLAS